MQGYKTLLPQVVLRFLLIVSFVESSGHEELGKVVDDLHPAEDGEAGEEPHGASDDSQSGLGGHPVILYYLIIGPRSNGDADLLESWKFWKLECVFQSNLCKDIKHLGNK